MRKTLIIYWFMFCLNSFGQSKSDSLTVLSRKATDPTAVMWQVQLEDFIVFKRYEENGIINTARLRTVIPIKTAKSKWDHLIRFTINSKFGSDDTWGFSDMELFDMIIPNRYPWGAWSIGPLLYLPTATNPSYGSGKWSGGLAGGLSLNHSKMGPWQLDVLIEYVHSFAGDASRKNVEWLKIQPSLTYHLSQGMYLESEPVISYDLTQNSWVIPFNIRLGKVWFVNDHKYNTYIEPETTAFANSMTGKNKLGIRFGFRFILEE